MKIDGNGQAKILSPDELTLLFRDGFHCDRDRALFAICLYSGCRVSEALKLGVADIKGGVITFRKATTKGKLKTRTIDIHPKLAEFLSAYAAPRSGALFPGNPGKNGITPHLQRSTADKILRAACDRVGIVGVSTHSFRRTALTMMSNGAVPLRHIQEISGHADLGTLQRYLEVTPEQKRKAIGAIGF